MLCAGMEANLMVLQTHLPLSQVDILVYRDVKCEEYIADNEKQFLLLFLISLLLLGAVIFSFISANTHGFNQSSRHHLASPAPSGGWCAPLGYEKNAHSEYGISA